MKLTAQQLAGFDKDARELLLAAQARGARIKVSNRMHALVYGPNGKTAAVPRKMNSRCRSAQNATAQVARLFR